MTDKKVWIFQPNADVFGQKSIVPFVKIFTHLGVAEPPY